MGSKMVTKQKAADLLDVTERSIYRYMRQGILKVSYQGGRAYLFEEDVLQLKHQKENKPKIPPSRETIPFLLARVQTLESRVSAMMRILNMKYENLSLTDPEYRTLHQMADVYSTQGWPPHSEEQWADTFIRIRLEDMEKIEECTEDPHPWRCFLRLVTSMHLNSYNKDLRDQFASGRNNVHSIAGIWCTLKGESPRTFDLLLQRDAEPLKKLMKKLGKTRN